MPHPNCNATAQTSLVGYTQHPSGYLALPNPSNQPNIGLEPAARSVQIVPPAEAIQQPAKYGSEPSSNTSSPKAAATQNDYLAVWVNQGIRRSNKFSGVTLDYPDFELDYEQCTAGLKSDPRMCLNILRNMVEGKALQSIAPSFVECDPEIALKEALETLKNAYGTDRKQCRAQLDKLLARPKVSPTEAGLLEFGGDLLRCYRIMKRCNRTIDLDSGEVLRSLFSKLPEYMQNRWEKEVHHHSEDKRPTYELLMKVVKEEHSRKTGDLNHWREDLRSKNQDPGQDRQPNPTKVNAAVVEGIGAVPQSGALPQWPQLPAEIGGNGLQSASCLCGSPGHSCLADCSSYRHARTVNERWSLLVGRGACFRCLKFGHIAIRCPEGNCSVNGCQQNHHPSLHPV